MGRGLDGLFVMPVVALCSFEGPGEAVSRLLPVALARGKHLFPFRTEQLSPSAPMVLGSQGPGRVGRRRFFIHLDASSPAHSGLAAKPGVQELEQVNGLVRYFRSNPQALVLLVICLVLGIGAFIAVVISFASAGSKTLNG